MADTPDNSEAWASFQILKEVPETATPGSVAEDILHTFGIELATGNGGGSLANVDIKRADALSTLKASLLESYAREESSPLYEIRINPEGEAEFYEVGASNASINPYYTIESKTYVKPKVGVTVTGAKPKQERIIYPWYQIIGPESTQSTIHDTTNLNSPCLSKLKTHATITYRDPLKNSSSNNWNNGVKDIFELQSPFERFIGFSWKVTPPEDMVSPFTKIYQQAQSSILVPITDPECALGIEGPHPNIGTLVRRKVMARGVGPDLINCTMFEDSYLNCSNMSVPLDIKMVEGLTYDTVRNTRVSKFLGIASILVVGVPLLLCFGVPRDDSAATQENTEENTILCVHSNNTFSTLIKLNESIHYATLYPKIEDDPTAENLPCIQFINNLRYLDYAKAGTAVDFYVNPLSVELNENVFGNAEIATGTILPLENRNGILIEQVWAQVNLDAACFIVTDPTRNAYEIAKKLKVELLAMAVKDVPSPIAINGNLIDQTDGIADNDPITSNQDFQDTAMEKALNDMGSGRTISLTMASLSEYQTTTLSRKLYDLLLEDDGAVYTHTCSPTDDPQVGDRGINGGIINVIEYSYTDQGSYLINVTEGPMAFGDFAGIDGGIFHKQTEEVTTKGTIIQNMGNHVEYKVHVDGYGPIWCINGCPNVLAVRDRVSITIHNNAVEK
jgi:hypothetical protein